MSIWIGKQMITTLHRKVLYLIGGLLLTFSYTDWCRATSHVFVLNEDGVWLVSDTLWLHNDGNTVTSFNKCKVVMTKGRLIFNAGGFTDLTALREQENALPIEDIRATEAKAVNLMKPYLQRTMFPNSDLMVMNVGIIQVQDGVFAARWAGLSQDLSEGYDDWVKTFRPGVPHGYGDIVKKVNAETLTDPTVEERIAKNPKGELIKMLEEETKSRPEVVGPPFSVLLLHRDGTISDMSDTPICEVPKDIEYVKQPPTPVAPPKITRKHWWQFWR
jgi:hypothetical protein